jgi:hypothetical protein
VAERVRVRETDDDEGRRLVRIVRRDSGSVVTWRRAQMVLLSTQGMDVAGIAKVAFTSEDRVRDERVPQHVRMRPGNPHTGLIGQAPEPARGGVAVHPGAAAVEQNGPGRAGADCPVDCPADRRWQRHQYNLCALGCSRRGPSWP